MHQRIGRSDSQDNQRTIHIFLFEFACFPSFHEDCYNKMKLSMMRGDGQNRKAEQKEALAKLVSFFHNVDIENPIEISTKPCRR